MSDYTKLIHDYHAGLIDPNTDMSDQVDRFMALVQACSIGEELSVKVKELIALAIAISAHCESGISHHAGAARTAGATRNEIGAVIGIATLMGCCPSSSFGEEALQAYDSYATTDG